MPSTSRGRTTPVGSATEAGQTASHRPARVYWALFFGLASFSFSPILVRLAADAPALAIASWRTMFAAGALLPFAIPILRKEAADLGKRDGLLIVAAGALLGIHFITWIESLYHTTVASASVLVTTSPIFLAVLGYVFLKERLSLPVTGSIVLAVGGAALLSLGDATLSETARAPALGNSLALGSSLLFSIYLLVGRVVRRKTSWLVYVFPLYTVTALTVVGMALAFETPLLGYDPLFFLLCAAMALGPQVIGHGSFNYAIRYFPAAILGLISLVEPVGASIMAYFLFGESPGPISLAGMAIVLISIGFAIVYRSRPRAEVPLQSD